MQLANRINRASTRAPKSRSVTNEPVSALPRHLLSATASVMLLLNASDPSLAFGPVNVPLNDIQVTLIDCKAGVSTVGGVTFSGQTSKAACLDVTATAVNPTKAALYNADVFGRVYDALGEAAIDDTENIRVAYVEEIPPGTSQVAFKLFVPREQWDLGPLKLKGFKASGFPGKMLPGQGSGLIGAQQNSDCDITGDCGDLDEAALIR